MAENKLTKTILNLEQIDTNLFRANYLWRTVTRGVYGGQIIGQALVAAAKTIPSHLRVHSLHCYFLLRGDGLKPIIYEVEIVRDGRSFSTRRVNAKQNGVVIFSCMASFHKYEVAEVTYQYAMPSVPHPDTLPLYEDIFAEKLKNGNLSDRQRMIMDGFMANRLTFLVKPVNPDSDVQVKKIDMSKRPRIHVWIKVRDAIDESDDALHRCAVAYISDSFILHAYLLFSNHDVRIPPAMVASLDHSLWFHSVFRADEWMLYECESPRMVGNRALYHGRIWKSDGTLAVSVAQEFLVRIQAKI